MIARRVYSRAGAHEGLHRRDHASHSQELHLDVALVVGWQRCSKLAQLWRRRSQLPISYLQGWQIASQSSLRLSARGAASVSKTLASQGQTRRPAKTGLLRAHQC